MSKEQGQGTSVQEEFLGKKVSIFKKYPTLYMIFAIGFLLVINLFLNTILSHFFGFDIKIFEFMNDWTSKLSYILNHTPIYDRWANNLERYAYYDSFSYTINQGIISTNGLNTKFFEYFRKVWFETIPFLILLIMFLPVRKSLYIKYWDYKYLNERKELAKKIRDPKFEPYSEEKRGYFIEMNRLYTKQNEERISNQFKNTESLLKSIIHSGGTIFFNKGLNKKDQESVSDYYKGILESEENLLTKRIYEYINDKDNFIVDRNGKVFNRELYFLSIDKEVDMETFVQWMKYVLYFRLAKHFGNFELYQYTNGLPKDTPLEIKKLCKWVRSNNRPRIYKKEDKIYEIYYRIYRFNKYVGRKYNFMEQYLEIFENDKKLGYNIRRRSESQVKDKLGLN